MSFLVRSRRPSYILNCLCNINVRCVVSEDTTDRRGGSRETPHTGTFCSSSVRLYVSGHRAGLCGERGLLESSRCCLHHNINQRGGSPQKPASVCDKSLRFSISLSFLRVSASRWPIETVSFTKVRCNSAEAFACSDRVKPPSRFWQVTLPMALCDCRPGRLSGAPAGVIASNIKLSFSDLLSSSVSSFHSQVGRTSRVSSSCCC